MAKINIANGIISSSADYGLYRGTSKIVNIQDGEFRVLGDLIAENYIVSSSVSNIEYQSLSGSTIFGDSADDTHQFTGSISATGSLTVNGGGGGHPLTLQTDTGDKGISLLNYQGTEIFQLRQEAGDAGLLMLKDGGDTKVLFTARPSNHSYINVSGGRFGLGTASPDTKLDIVGDDFAGASLKIERTGDGENDDPALRLNRSGTVDANDRIGGIYFQDNDTSLALIRGEKIGADDGRLDFVVPNGSAVSNTTAPVMTIQNDKVGIGTINPGVALEVVGSISGSSTSTGSFGSLVVTGNQTIAGSTTYDGAVQINGNTTFGVDGTGVDITLFGDTAGRKIKWDQSADQLKFYDNTKIVFGTGVAEADSDAQIYYDGSNLRLVNEGGVISLEDDVNVTGDVSGSSTSTGSFGALVVPGKATIGNSLLTGFDDEANDLIVGDGTGDSGLTIYGGQNAGDFGSIHFADGTSSTAAKAGYIKYEQNTSAMTFGINGVTRATLDISGHFQPTGNVSGSATSTGSFGQVESAGRILLKGTSNTISAAAITQHSNGYVYFSGGSSGLVVGNSDTTVRTQYMGSSMQFETDSTVRFKLDNNSRISISNNDSGGTGGSDSTSANTILGYLAGDDIASGGVNNSFVGHAAGHKNTTGDENSGFGRYAGFGNLTGDNNTFVGSSAGLSDNGSSHSNNTGIGKSSLTALTTGGSNVAIGYNSADAMTTGHNNVAIGLGAMGSSTNIGYAVAIGSEALNNANATDASDSSVAVGNKALYALVSGIGNVAVGGEALSAEDDGDHNTAIGHHALKDQTGTSGTVGNTALGYKAGKGVVKGTRNTFIGTESGLVASASSAIDNVGVGAISLKAMVSGSRNTAVGTWAAQQMVNARDIVSIGYYTLANALTSTDIDGSVAIGSFSQAENRTGIGNTSVGFETLLVDVNGDHNTAIGYQALKAQTGNSGEVANTAVGYQAGLAITTGTQNTALGSGALKATDDGGANTAIGAFAMGVGNAGSNNTAVGNQCLVDVTGNHNVAVGFQTLFDLTSGGENIGIGHSAGKLMNGAEAGNTIIGIGSMADANNDSTAKNVTLGNYTLSAIGTNAQEGLVAIGYEALKNLTSGVNNTAVGYQSLKTENDGSRNTAIGYKALTTLNTSAGNGQTTAVGFEAGMDVSTGINNTFVGSRAGNQGTNDITTGDNNTLIGMEARASAAGAANQTVIGASAIGVANNSVTLGNGDTTAVYMSQDAGATVFANYLALGLGTTAPESGIEVRLDDSLGQLQLGDNSGNIYHRYYVSMSGAFGNGTAHHVPRGVPGSGTSNFFTHFKTVVGGGTTNHNVVVDGKVGIGTTSPAYKLQVSQAESAASDFQTNLDLVRTWDAGSSTDRYHGLIFSDSNSVNAGIFANRLASHANYNSDLHFYTNSGSSNMTPATALSTSKMMITAAGLVGIGTSSPDGELHVHAASAGTVTAPGEGNNFIIEDTATPGMSILMGDTTKGSIYWGSPSDNDRMSIIGDMGNNRFDFAARHAADVMRFRPAGGVLNLTLKGAAGSEMAQFEGTISGSLINSSGDVVAFNASDERLKDNIKIIKEPIEKIKQLRGVEYQWNEKQNTYPTGSLDSGIIAQDVQKVLPQLVKERGDGYLGVRQERLVGLLVESIKDQQDQIDDLRKQIKEMKDGSS